MTTEEIIAAIKELQSWSRGVDQDLNDLQQQGANTPSFNDLEKVEESIRRDMEKGAD